MHDLKKDHILDNRFSLISLLGEGGMGQVWLACDEELEEKVALKVLHKDLSGTPHLVELLKNECRNTRKLIHPHIVRIFDFHRSNHLVYVSMEYIDGHNLDRYRRDRGLLAYRDVIIRLLPIIDALSYAHGFGLVHRDVKASNVLIDRQGPIRLADFGIASVIHSDPQGMTIKSGGSLFCMSPQQLSGSYPHPSDDIYALGVLMYDLLTGHPPFYPSITHEKIIHEMPLSVNKQLEHINAGITVPSSLDELIMTMLAKNAEERPSTLLEVRDALDDIREDTFYHTLPPSGRAVYTTSSGSVPPPEPEPSVIPELTVPGRFTPSERTDKKGQYFIKMALFIVVLIGTILGGVVLIDYLKTNPIKTVSPSEDMGIEEKGTDDKRKRLSQQKDPEKKRDKPSAVHKPPDKKSDKKQLSNKLAAKDAPVEKKVVPVPVIEEDKKAVPEKKALPQAEKEPVYIPEPEYEEVRKPVKRADPARQLIASGKKNERRGKLTRAHADYEKALEVSPDSREARTGLSRVKDLLTQKEFKQHLSSGLAAYHKEDYEHARKELLKAHDLRPDSSEVKNALFQVDGAIRLVSIDRLKEKSCTQEKAEDWESALKSYEELLKIDGSLDFAREGKKRSTTFFKLSKNITYYLNKPELLQSDQHLKTADRLVQEAQKIDLKGRQLPQKVEKLQSLVKMARIPVILTLQSDNKTEVAVYKVGKLGTFETRQLELRPGTYTIVGARDRYKDVRKEVVIRAGQIPPIIVIQCQEKI